MLGRLSFASVLFLFIAASSARAGGDRTIYINPTGFNGHVGGGFSNFTVSSPSSEFKFDPGLSVNFGGEKGLGALNLALTFGINYLTAQGQAHYRYKTLSGTTYNALDANFKQDLFEVSLGMKFRLIDGFFIKPYVEGGGSFGYSVLQFNFTDAQKLAFGNTNYKSQDSLFALGKYAEGGAEISFSPTFGLYLAAREEWIETKEFDTLYSSSTNLPQKLIFATTTYYVGVLKAF